MCPCHEDKKAGGRVDFCDTCKAAGCTDPEAGEPMNCKRDEVVPSPPADDPA
jgi:hypothetical protein